MNSLDKIEFFRPALSCSHVSRVAITTGSCSFYRKYIYIC